MAQRGNRPKDPASTKGGVRGTHGLGDTPRTPASSDASTAEEHEFELSNAMSPLESMDERAAQRERAASEARGDDDSATDGEGAAQADPFTDPEERKERSLATETVPGPGPKDKDAGRATKKHLETHGLEPQAHRRH
jgi:hypothetical protein